MAVAMTATGCCTALTWQTRADEADAAVGGTPADASPEELVAAGELALVVRHDPARARELLQAGLHAAAPESPTATRAALALVELSRALGQPEIAVGAIARVVAATTDPMAAAALANAAGDVWGQLADVGAAPEDLVTALERLATTLRPPSWADARVEAALQLRTAALVASPDHTLVESWGAAAGLLTRWRVSAPWGAAPHVDFKRVLPPETRPLGAQEQTGARLGPMPVRTDHLTLSDGEVTFAGLAEVGGGVGYAESWIEAPAGTWIVVELTTNRSVSVFAGPTRVLTHDRAAGARGWRARGGLVMPDSGRVRLLMKLASGDGRGFAALRAWPLDSTITVSPTDAAPDDGLGLAVAVFPAPPDWRAAWAVALPAVDPAGAVRALRVADSRVRRPVRDLGAARAAITSIREAVGAYPGLDLLEADVAGVDRDLTRRVARSQLRDAIERALAVWPEDVRALRALAAIDRDDARPEDARATWQRILALRPGDVPTTVALLSDFAELGWEPQALEVARSLETLAGSGPRALQEVFDVYQRFGRISDAVRVAADLEARFPRAARTRLAALDALRGEHASRADRLVAAWRERPERFDLARAAVSAARAAGDLQRARQVLARVLSMRPEDAWVHGQLADISVEAGDVPAARAAIARGLAADPDHGRLEALAAWLDGGPQPLDAIADGRELLAAWRARPAADRERWSGDNAVTLLDRTAWHLRPDGSVLTLTHVMRIVQTRSAADRLGELRVPGKARLLVARTLKPDGAELWPEHVQGKPDLSFSGLQPGDVMEWAWVTRATLRPEEGGYLGGLSFGTWDFPTVHKQVTVRTPPGLTLEPRLHGGAEAPVTRELPDGAWLATWNARNLPSVGREPLSVNARAFFPLVDLVVRTASDATTDAPIWDDITRWYASQLRRLTTPGPRVRHALAAIGSDAARDLYRFVLGEVSNEERFNGFESTAEQALAVGKGSRVIVLLALARAARLDAELLLCAPAPDGPPADAGRPLPAANRFWYPVVRFGDGSRADPSRAHNPFGSVPPSVEGAACIRVAGEPRFTQLGAPPALETMASVWQATADLALSPEGDARGVVTLRAQGPDTDGLRVVWQRSDDSRRELVIQQWMSSVLPGARTESVESEHVGDGDEAMIWRVKVAVDGMFGRSDGALAAPRLGETTWADALASAPGPEQLFSLPRRHTPLRLPAHSEDVTIRLTAPPGGEFQESLGDLVVAGDGYRLEQRVSRRGAVLEIFRSVRFAPGRVEPDRYRDVRREVGRAIEGFAGPVSVVGTPPNVRDGI